MFNWFRVLWNLTDEKLLELNGADYTLYLVFLRQTAKFFLVMTVFNAVFMIPIYISGNSNTDLPSIMLNSITVNNITAKNGKLMFTYFSSMILMSGMSFFLILRYR